MKQMTNRGILRALCLLLAALMLLPLAACGEKAPAETEERKERTEAPVSKGSIGVKVTSQTETAEDEDIFSTGEKSTKTKWWKKFQDKVTNMGNSFVGNDEDNDF